VREPAVTTLPRALAQTIARATRKPYPPRTPAQRQAQMRRVRSLWAEGKMANRQRRKPVRPDVWTPAHDRRLRELVGQVPVAEIAARLTAAFPDTPRSEIAVKVRLGRLGLSPVLVHYNARAVGYLFAVDPKTVSGSWIARGWLQATQQRPGVAGSSWIITAAALEAFIRDHLEVFDWRAMPPSRWRSLAEVEWRRDPLISITDAAPIAGLAPETLRRHLREGRIPGVRRFQKPGPQHGIWLIRRSSLLALRVDRRAEPGFRVIPLHEARALVAAWDRERGQLARAARGRKGVAQ
jgi:hypothetical protein